MLGSTAGVSHQGQWTAQVVAQSQPHSPSLLCRRWTRSHNSARVYPRCGSRSTGNLSQFLAHPRAQCGDFRSGMSTGDSLATNFR